MHAHRVSTPLCFRLATPSTWHLLQGWCALARAWACRVKGGGHESPSALGGRGDHDCGAIARKPVCTMHPRRRANGTFHQAQLTGGDLAGCAWTVVVVVVVVEAMLSVSVTLPTEYTHLTGLATRIQSRTPLGTTR